MWFTVSPSGRGLGRGHELVMPTVSGAGAASRVMDVLERVAPGGLAAGRPRAGLADSDHQHLGVYRLEPVAGLEVPLQLAHHSLFHMHHAPPKPAAHVVMGAAGPRAGGRP